MIQHLAHFLIKPVIAADVPLGDIGGVGPFQSSITTSALAKSQLSTFITTLITSITVAAGIAFLVFFLFAAFRRITSGGDKNSLSEANSQLTQAAIGLVVVILAIFIVNIIGGILGLDILNPGKLLGL